MEENAIVRTLVAQRVKVLAYIQSLVRRHHLAEDIFQDVCVLAVEKRHAIQNEAHLLNWLRTTARLRALNVLRNRQERQLALSDNLLELLETEWTQHDAEDSVASAEALRHCMQQLPAHCRTLINQRYVQGHSYAKLAEELKRPVESLYVTFSRIHAVLADCISRRLAADGGSHG